MILLVKDGDEVVGEHPRCKPLSDIGVTLTRIAEAVPIPVNLAAHISVQATKAGLLT